MNERAERWERRFELPVLAAAVLVIPVIAIEESDASERWRSLAGIANWLIWLAFAAEFVVLLAVTPDRWRWLRRHPLELAVVVLTPPFLPAGLQAARVLRLVRVVRLLRLATLARRLFSLQGVRYAGLLAVVTAFVGGAAFAAVENHPRVSTWDGFYWAVTTMTTVGYGDIQPHTGWGKAIAIVVMLVGIGFVAILTAAIAGRFVAGDVREEVGEAQAEASEELSAAEADVLGEIADIAARLQRVEGMVRRLQRAEQSP